MQIWHANANVFAFDPGLPLMLDKVTKCLSGSYIGWLTCISNDRESTDLWPKDGISRLIINYADNKIRKLQ